MTSEACYYKPNLIENNMPKEGKYKPKDISQIITGKKRKYEEAMGYPNEYEIVQECENMVTNKIENRGLNWIDSYFEQMLNVKNNIVN